MPCLTVYRKMSAASTTLHRRNWKTQLFLLLGLTSTVIRSTKKERSYDLPDRVFFKNKSKMRGGLLRFPPYCAMTGKHFMRFQSENAVFKIQNSSSEVWTGLEFKFFTSKEKFCGKKWVKAANLVQAFCRQCTGINKSLTRQWRLSMMPSRKIQKCHNL